MIVDHRKESFFGGIVLQEYSVEEQKLIGEQLHIADGTVLGNTEAPHIYEKDEYYYLLLAEGGTEYGHAVTMMRSKALAGPYEVHPDNPWITANHDPTHALQKCGHADMVEGPSGEWYVVFLTGRPLTEKGQCTTGRETALEKMIWKDGWPYLEAENKLPRKRVWFDDIEVEYQGQTSIYNFNTEKLSLDFQSLRVPMTDDWCSLTDRKGFLRLYGRESLSSFHKQSLIARRITEHNCRAIAILDYQPKHYQQMAGLVMYYNTYHWHYLHVTADDDGNRVLQIINCDKYNTSTSLDLPIQLSKTNDIVLRAEWHRDSIQCYFQDGSKVDSNRKSI